MTKGITEHTEPERSISGRKENKMWIDTRNYEPLEDGTYLVQMAGGYLTGMNYTIEGGWNTSRDSNGILSKEDAMDYKRVARWLDAPKPADVPEEWVNEWLES